MDLTGKWRYEENYTYGRTKGELLLKQTGDRLSGKIIFTDEVNGESAYMIQETLTGYVDGDRVKLDAEDYDVIYAEQEVAYELDSWFGTIVDEDMISGLSKDLQGVVGHFSFVRMKDNKNRI